MSSTDESDPAAAFFADTLVPAADRLRERGVELIATALDGNESTWFTPFVEQPRLESYDARELAERLTAMWRDIPELAELAKPLAELAQAQRTQAEQSGEVAPFVYVMF